ncbi:hypothetical protein ACFO5R_02000 [Halosolutus amylolyticus]|uniref:HVO-0234-like beta-propeller domain-containing protein n=1 Tax=Halosolutus amylolyticus TaxID=2932267 RepID=A0ABD5PK37_9EURY|nr:hypothetical protein [Halosolutus amylolyticus]
MHSIEEKRVYGDRSGAVEAYVASSVGVVRVRVAGDTVGEFGLCDRCDARDVAATRTGTKAGVAIATDEDIRVLDATPAAESADERADDPTFVDTGFGPAVAVGYDGETLLAADASGRIARRVGDEWTTLADDAIETVTAIDGDLVGTGSGVYRVRDDELDHAGLTDVRDVSAAGVPLAATADGLYKLGNGWMTIREGSVDVVAADPRSDRNQLGRAHAVADRTVYAHDPADGEWQAMDGPDETVVGIDYGETVYAVSERGTFYAAIDGDGPGTWRSQTIGVGDVTGIAVPGTR